MLPAPELDDKRFAELVEAAKARIPVYAPEWTDHNIHDPGITFIELFAWLTEMQIYHLDQVTEKSRRKFLKLLGMKPRSAIAAKADVTFSLPDEYTACALLRRGTKVAAKDVEEGGEKIVFETDRDIHVVPVKLECVISKFWAEIRDNTEANTLDGHFYHAFGERAEEGSMLYLGFDGAEEFPHDEIDFMVYLYEADLEPRVKGGEEEPVIIPSAEVKWEYSSTPGWAPLELLRDETASFTCSGWISFRLPTGDIVKSSVAPCAEAKYWIRCRVEKAGYEIPPRIDAIQLNTVPVTQGETVKDEIVGSSTGLPHQSFSLEHKPVLAEGLVISVLNIPELSADVPEGARSAQLSSVPGLQKDDLIKIDDITKEEYQISADFAIMVQKMRFAHDAASVVVKKVRLGAPLWSYTLSLDAAEGADSLLLNRAQGLKKDDILSINDPDCNEYVIIRRVSDTTVTLTGTLLATHKADTIIEKVDVEEVSLPATYELSADVTEGADSLKMAHVPGLQQGDLLKIEDRNADKVEYQLIAGITLVVQKMRFAHRAATPLERVEVEETGAYELSADAEEGADSLRLSDSSGLQRYDVLKIDGADKREYAIIDTVTDTTVTLTGKLLYGHAANTQVTKVRVDKSPLSEHDKTWRDWQEVDDFDASGPEDPHYVIDHDKGEVAFGDGVHGLIPPVGKRNIKATYRFGGGEKGNIKAGAIDLILDGAEKIKELNVKNKLRASGGEEKEALDTAVIRARRDLKEPYRAVTAKDYEVIAKKTPGIRVKRAKALPEKEKGSVTVVVVPESTRDKPEPSEGFLMTVCKYLDKHRLITTEVHVKKPEYVEVSVNAVVRIKRGAESEKVKQQIEEALMAFLHPLKGGPEGEGWPFGRSVFNSELYERIDGIAGVECVLELRMVDGAYSYDGEKIEIPEAGLVYSGKHTIRITRHEEECREEGGVS